MFTSQAYVSPRGLARLGRIAAVLGFATLTGVASRIVYDPPGAAVPFTMQTAAVIAAGLLLGSRRGAASQLAYLAAIAIGVPLDARLHGAAALFGPTAGYLLGFVAAAYAAGWLAERARHSLVGRTTGAVVGIGLIYLCGWAWLSVVLGSGTRAFAAGVAPFVVADALKAAAVVAGTGLRRKP